MAQIYRIRDITNDITMYVGKTIETHERRFLGHVHSANLLLQEGNCTLQNYRNTDFETVAGWIAFCWANKYEIKSELIGLCEDKDVLNHEKDFIHLYQNTGFYLLNVQHSIGNKVKFPYGYLEPNISSNETSLTKEDLTPIRLELASRLTRWHRMTDTEKRVIELIHSKEDMEIAFRILSLEDM